MSVPIANIMEPADWQDREMERLEAENAKLRGLCKELLDLCYDAYEQRWGWDDDWALAYEQAKKLGIEAFDD